MNLQKKFTAQAELDAYIEQQHPTTEGENRLEKKVLALLVELGECANEWRGFKFWSNRQTPNELEWINEDCKSCKGTGVDVEGVALGNPYPCIECEGKSIVAYSKNPLLEEYVDCLHFILSIGNDLGLQGNDKTEFKDIFHWSTEKFFVEISSLASQILKRTGDGLDVNIEYSVLVSYFLILSLRLGFTIDQIEEAYWKKYEINKQRQVEGY